MRGRPSSLGRGEQEIESGLSGVMAEGGMRPVGVGVVNLGMRKKSREPEGLSTQAEGRGVFLFTFW